MLDQAADAAPNFLIESYLAPGEADDLPAALRLCAAADTADAARYLMSVLVPDEEMCLHFFRAPSAEAVREISRRAGLGSQRVIRCELRAAPTSPEPSTPELA
jgi:hypothetical protein